MPNIDYLIEICETEREKVRVLENDLPEIAEMALDIAYYYAMLDAANDDPLDDEDEHTALTAYLLGRLKELIERYQSTVNAYL